MPLLRWGLCSTWFPLEFFLTSTRPSSVKTSLLWYHGFNESPPALLKVIVLHVVSYRHFHLGSRPLLHVVSLLHQESTHSIKSYRAPPISYRHCGATTPMRAYLLYQYHLLSTWICISIDIVPNLTTFEPHVQGLIILCLCTN